MDNESIEEVCVDKNLPTLVSRAEFQERHRHGFKGQSLTGCFFVIHYTAYK